MTLESLTTQDEVTVQVATESTDNQMGADYSWADVATLSCLVQTPGANESQKYKARGMEFTHTVFFSTRPALSQRNRFKWTDPFGSVVYLRILDQYGQGRPGEYFLWVVDCSQETTRRETG